MGVAQEPSRIVHRGVGPTTGEEGARRDVQREAQAEAQVAGAGVFPGNGDGQRLTVLSDSRGAAERTA